MKVSLVGVFAAAVMFIVLPVGCAMDSQSLAPIYGEVLADPDRLPEAVSRDADRKPLMVLRFSEVAEGDHVVEIAPGGGYYTAILSRVVGPNGRVTAVDPERLFRVFPRGRNGFPDYSAKDPRDNVDYSVQELDNISLPSGIDQVWMVLFYHDTLWTGENRSRMNKRLFDALKPGGKYLVVDHHALPGAEPEVGKTLHRMDRAIAVREIEAAGFEKVADSGALSYPSDPRTDSVFGEERRGKTDRFMILFRKPD